MKYYLALLICLTALVSCSPAENQARLLTPPAVTTTKLTEGDKIKVAKKIWQNESGGQIEGLTAWNDGEDFPSLGIGHFIWYPAGKKGPFTESFPQFVKYALARGYDVPEVARQQYSPWKTQREFKAKFPQEEMRNLRNWLALNLPIQTEFIIGKSRAALPKVLRAASPENRERVRKNYEKVASTSNGTYALIDYVNFKGEGINVNERYQGKGWGLLQVLEGMNDVGSGQAAAREFSASAKRALGRRISLAPPSRGENRWKAGWFNRCNTYAQPL